MDIITYAICITGLLILPWINDRHLNKMRQQEEEYEKEHKEELYGTDVMHVDIQGNVDTNDWK